MNANTAPASVFNALAAELRATQQPMPVPADVAPPVIKPPRNLAHINVDPATEKACARFARDYLAATEKVTKAENTAFALATAFVKTIHGDKAPDYATYKKVRAELRAQCELLGHGIPLEFDTVRKAYANAIKKTFGALPESDSPEAQRKAAARAAKGKPGRKAGTTGIDAKAGESATIPEHELIGQFIAKHGVSAVLVELAKILGTEKATVDDAHMLIDIARHYAK